MPDKPDILDSLIAIAIILFIISVIVEKITQLIRRYSPFINPRGRMKKTVFGSFWRNINFKQTGNKEFDKKIEREVNSLSFMLSVLIAFLFKVDLFKMFATSGDPRSVLFWKSNLINAFHNHTNIEIILFIISIALTGFFLTFGSKFFHDLIDTLLQVKNLKRKLVDDNTFNVESVDQLDDFLNKTHSDIIQTAIEQNRDLLQGPDNMSPPMHGKCSKDGKIQDCIDIHLAGNNRGKIPSFVEAKLEKGQVIKIPVNVIFDVEVPKALSVQGNTVANVGSANFKGTICCKISQEGQDNLLLTCSHVMNSGSGKNNFGKLSTPISAVIDGDSDGNFIWGLCNEKFDAAVVKPTNQNFQYTILPKKERLLKPSDMMSTKVRICRQNSNSNNQKINEGSVVNYCCPMSIPIQYSDGEFGMTDLIILSKVIVEDDQISYATLTIEGDSGACVYDDQDRPIAMIVAGNTKFSYAICIVNVLKQLKAKITH